ncbi:hypothetical protein ACJJTC_011666 [Scirpophaga incertulas]
MSRPTSQQLESLVEFLELNPGIAKGLLHTAHAKNDTRRKWDDISLNLNALGGVQKTGKGWESAETCAENFQKDDNTIQPITEPEEIPKTQDKETMTTSIITVEKSVQSKIQKHCRSKYVQTKLRNKSISTSPFKVSTTSSSTSPIKIQPCRGRPLQSGVAQKLKRHVLLEDDKSDSDISCFESGHLSPSITTPSSRVTDSDTNVTDTNENIEQLQCLKITMNLISKKPLMYIGISKECYFFVQLLHKHTNVKIEHILLCLKKIRLNSTFSELEDNFGISLSYASKIFLANIPIISSYLRSLIVKLDKSLTKKNLPIAFRHNYHDVSCIIDCLEIDIQKPSILWSHRALYQALTWSEYKKGNTVKYLISCTPNGLINYISQGFGGRASDVTIVENCNFLDELQPGSCILADRGFKHIEQILHEKGIKLLRPPSVIAGAKLSKAEVRQTKIIASLRIHVERVIRRLREFHMLKQHSVINNNLIRVLDHVIIIACALINLQDSIIK